MQNEVKSKDNLLIIIPVSLCGTTNIYDCILNALVFPGKKL
jgi:hypothetical protein